MSSITTPPPPTLQLVAAITPFPEPPWPVGGRRISSNKSWKNQRRTNHHLLKKKKKKTLPATPSASRRHLDGLTGSVADEQPVLWQGNWPQSLRERRLQEEDLGEKTSSFPLPPWPAGRGRSSPQIHPTRWPDSSALLREIVVLVGFLGSDRRSC
jgi:hypothetical protein